MNKAVIPLAIFVALVGLFLFVLSRINDGEYNPRDVPTQFIGRPAPNFSLPDLLDPKQTVSPEQYRGKAWLLNVFGSWCSECWSEQQYLMFLAKDRHIPIVGLNWRDTPTDAMNMLTTAGNPYLQVASDPHSKVAINYGVYGAPETFLIDAQGIIRAKIKGPIDEQLWQAKFAPYFKAQK